MKGKDFLTSKWLVMIERWNFVLYVLQTKSSTTSTININTVRFPALNHFILWLLNGNFLFQWKDVSHPVFFVVALLDFMDIYVKLSTIRYNDMEILLKSLAG